MNISSRHNIVSLKERSEVNTIFEKGKKISTRYGPVFLYKSMTDHRYTKVAILLKKNTGTAVKRNYIKRIIRNFVRKNRSCLDKYNRIIFLFNSKKTVNYKLLEREYIRALQK
jgi:ribonuclease P protein component